MLKTCRDIFFLKKLIGPKWHLGMVKEMKVVNCQNHQYWKQRLVNFPRMECPSWQGKSVPWLMEGRNWIFSISPGQWALMVSPQNSCLRRHDHKPVDRRSLASWPCLCFLICIICRHREATAGSHRETQWREGEEKKILVQCLVFSYPVLSWHADMRYQ